MASKFSAQLVNKFINTTRQLEGIILDQSSLLRELILCPKSCLLWPMPNLYGKNKVVMSQRSGLCYSRMQEVLNVLTKKKKKIPANRKCIKRENSRTVILLLAFRTPQLASINQEPHLLPSPVWGLLREPHGLSIPSAVAVSRWKSPSNHRFHHWYLICCFFYCVNIVLGFSCHSI